LAERQLFNLSQVKDLGIKRFYFHGRQNNASNLPPAICVFISRRLHLSTVHPEALRCLGYPQELRFYLT
jgi:hypothetical protein